MSLATPALGAATASDTIRAQLHRKDRDARGMIMLIVLLGATVFTLGVLFVLMAQIIGESSGYLAARGPSFLSDTIGSNPDRIGVKPAIYGSAIIGVFVVFVTIPLGVAAAVYLEEYASGAGKLTRFIMVNIRNLAGVPAVIYGVLGLIMFTQWLDPLTGGKTVVAAGLTMAVLVLPIVVITSLEAIRAVPSGLRDAGFGVGAGRWRVIRDHVIPYALPGILTGVVLSIARALGEAAPLILVGAITGLLPAESLRGPFTALPILIYTWSGRPQPPGSELSFTEAAAATGLVLLMIVLIFNGAAVYLRNRFEGVRVGA